MSTAVVDRHRGVGTPAAASRRVGPAPTLADRDDARLLAALRAQDPAVADPLWRRFAPMVFRLLRRVLGPWAPIEDAVHVVLLCAFHGGRRLRPHADLTRFVVRTIARIAQAELRSRTSGWSPSAWRAFGAGRVTARETAEREAVQRFYRILDRLGAVDRIAFVFHYVEGLDAREVAAAIGRSPAQTDRCLRRSLATVVQAIDGDPVLRPMRRASPS
ncbi:MAG TPA: sigma-70 family RNA polymerase sigma factor [Polyangia bacterium]|nr:sigma-70 family RNA polymerase sigma factor [Polyangia bacterium]